jgi:hypothetical protein
MIVDIHGHTNAPPGLYAYIARLLTERGVRGKGAPTIGEEAFANAVNHHIKNNLDAVGTDIQFISPRPVYLMHSELREAGENRPLVHRGEQQRHRHDTQDCPHSLSWGGQYPDLPRQAYHGCF